MTLSDCSHLAHVIVVWQIQKLYVTVLFWLSFIFRIFQGNFQVQAPGGLYSEGRFNEGVFALRVLGGLYLEGLLFENICY